MGIEKSAQSPAKYCPISNYQMGLELISTITIDEI